jgi:hypothetical protein
MNRVALRRLTRLTMDDYDLGNSTPLAQKTGTKKGPRSATHSSTRTPRALSIDPQDGLSAALARLGITELHGLRRKPAPEINPACNTAGGGWCSKEDGGRGRVHGTTRQ